MIIIELEICSLKLENLIYNVPLFHHLTISLSVSTLSTRLNINYNKSINTYLNLQIILNMNEPT